MADLTVLFGPQLGPSVLFLVEKLLASPRMLSPTGALQFFDGNAQSVLDLLDGTVSGTLSSDVRIQQRDGGTDADRMLRSPIIVATSDVCWPFAEAFLAALQVVSPAPFQVCTEDRRFLMVTGGDQQITDGVRIKCTELKSFPGPAQMAELSNRMPEPSNRLTCWYLSATQKLAFIFMALFSRLVRSHLILVEATLARTPTHPRGEMGAWLEPGSGRVPGSIRANFYGCLKWLCIGGDIGRGPAPRLSLASYIPTSEDNNVMSVMVGRIFDQLMLTDLVHYKMHLTGPAFANDPKTRTVFPAIDSELARCMVVVIFFLYYRLMQWSMKEARVNPLAKDTFVSFVRTSIGVLFIPGFVLPEHLKRFSKLFYELRELILVGRVAMQEPTSCLGSWLKKIRPDGRGLDARRVIICIAQYAKYLKDQEADDSMKGEPSSIPWLRHELQFFSPKQLSRLQPFSTVDFSVNRMGVLIRGVAAESIQDALSDVLRQLGLFKDSFARFMSVNPSYRDDRRLAHLDVQIADVVHPVFTNLEPMCMMAIPVDQLSASLHGIQAYLSNLSVVASGQSWDAQARLHLIAAIAQEREHLFHWLFAIRHTIQSVNWVRRQEWAKPDRGLPCAWTDEAQDAAFSALDVNGNNSFLQQASLICTKGFANLLLNEAHWMQPSSRLDYVLDALCLSFGEATVVTRSGFWRLCVLLPGFESIFCNDDETELGEDRKSWIQEQQSFPAADENYFGDASFFFRSDIEAMLASEAGRFTAADDYLPPWIKIGSMTLTWILTTLTTSTTMKPLHVLHAFVQLKPVVFMTPPQMKTFLPWLAVSRGVVITQQQRLSMDRATVVVDQSTPTQSLFSWPAAHGPPIAVYEAVCRHFGLGVADDRLAADGWFSALINSRLIVNGRKPDEVFAPVNSFVNMFNDASTGPVCRFAITLLRRHQSDAAVSSMLNGLATLKKEGDHGIPVAAPRHHPTRRRSPPPQQQQTDWRADIDDEYVEEGAAGPASSRGKRMDATTMEPGEVFDGNGEDYSPTHPSSHGFVRSSDHADLGKPPGHGFSSSSDQIDHGNPCSPMHQPVTPPHESVGYDDDVPMVDESTMFPTSPHGTKRKAVDQSDRRGRQRY